MAGGNRQADKSTTERAMVETGSGSFLVKKATNRGVRLPPYAFNFGNLTP
jgi:hypothetical protein